MNNDSVLNNICDYYIVSRKPTTLKNKDTRTAYRLIGCYDCMGVNKECVHYQNLLEIYNVQI